MRNILIIGMLIGGASMAGWFTVNRDGDSTTIEINKAEIRNDARQAIDRGREILDKRQQQAAAEQRARSSFASETDPPASSQPYGAQGYPPLQYGPPQYSPQTYGRPSPDAYPQPSYGNPSYPPPQDYNRSASQPAGDYRPGY